MHQQGLQLIIRQKLKNGTLPNNSIPRVWGGPGNGESVRRLRRRSSPRTSG